MRWAIIYGILMIFCACVPAALRAQEVRIVPDSVSERMKKEEDFRYANDPSYWQKKQREDNSPVAGLFNFLGSPAMKVILYIILALIILFIIYQVAVVNNFFVSTGKK